jgi:GTPase
MENEVKNKTDYKAGFLGIIGQPNAGKSSLMNYLIKEKISIVTSKPQTTRRRILGLHSETAGQVVFVDAPGIVQSTTGLNSFLQKEAEDVIRSSDSLMAVLSISEDKIENNEEIINMVVRSNKPWFAVITKTDLTDKLHRITLLKDLIKKHGGHAISVSIKNTTDEDRKLILDECLKMMPAAPAPLYDTELFTTENVKSILEEIIREKCFEILEYEVPYQLAVQTRKFDEDAKPCPKIYVDIIIAKDTHKPIVIGKAGANIKRIGEQAREEIQKIMDVDKVYLELNVVVKNGWFENKTAMKDLKYVVDGK